MRMFVDTGRRASTTLPPPQELKVLLNPEECKVWSVECTLGGKLFYRNKGSFKKCFDIASVRFIDVYTDMQYASGFNVHADFDIITKDGRVIEISTWSRKLIVAARAWAETPDPRAALRAARRGYV